MYRKPIAALAGALLLVGAVAVPAGAKSGDAVTKSRCTLGAKSKLKLAPRASNKRTKVEFEVDSNRVGQVWNVQITDNGVVAFAGTKTTAGRSGSFEARAKLAGATGHVVAATANDPASGQTCSMSASV